MSSSLPGTSVELKSPGPTPTSAPAPRAPNSIATFTSPSAPSAASAAIAAPNRTIKHVIFGTARFATWFDSFYPPELVAGTDTLFVCPRCFRYATAAEPYTAHVHVCGEHRHEFGEGLKQDLGPVQQTQGDGESLSAVNATHPPGTKVYEHGGYAVWEVDGERNKLFAQNLSLFAKLFLDHKSVFFDVSTFLYYILTFADPASPIAFPVILGYFSKEKQSWDPNNLACILVFPPFQRRHLGRLLMGVSYKLSGWEWDGGGIGGPERPLSDLGLRGYTRFWAERVARFFLSGRPPGGRVHVPSAAKATRPQRKKGLVREVKEFMTVQEVGDATGMLAEDVIAALQEMGVVDGNTKKDQRGLVVDKEGIRQWAKAHWVSLQDPVPEEGFLGQWPSMEDEE